MRFVAVLLLGSRVGAECPNACSGHGTCGAFDECTCYPNYQGGDCSLRTCPFATSHVDSPKGDLDGSADELSGPDTTVIVDSTVFPYGTTEQYPLMVDSRGYTLVNTAHAYTECANKGICDRKSGECECFEGYEGAACQRASCPDPQCSGHGTCQTAAEIAWKDNSNEYKLWDKDLTMGCVCEPGYTGPSCADKMCKYGVDPLYDDDEYMSIRVPTARVIFENKNRYMPSGENGKLAGTYAIKFYDVFGEDYHTTPILVNSTCEDITTALEELPNAVVPKDSVMCNMQNEQNKDEIAYDLTFQENPGDLTPIEIDMYLDGSRTTVYNDRTPTTEKTYNITVDYNVSVTVYPNYYGIAGEFVDYFSEYCKGVSITMSQITNTYGTTAGVRGRVDALSKAESKLLKKCLGDSNGDSSDNVEVYDWDFGTWNTTLYPHIVKIAPHPTVGTEPKADVYDAGKFYLLWFNENEGPEGTFYTGNLPEAVSGKEYTVFTTHGVASVITNATRTIAKPSMVNLSSALPVTGYFDKGKNMIYTSADASCYHSELATCLEKGDLIFLFDANWPTDVSGNLGKSTITSIGASNSGNLYKIVKIGINHPTTTTYLTEDRYYIVVDKVINWDGSKKVRRGDLGLAPQDQYIGHQWIIKFVPEETNGNYEYVQECSGRGLCDMESGLCECFTGYTNDNCDLQSSLAV
ncbi:hypothetical protein CTAYLR_007768 [Chrysophaeum taylorii]|uniref:EGF-like domain-containing protein n=1 Tax=Chrysophaeum taylorii TaxID=2483200 RepID=A0AAD7UMS0_9STRA|nr:hypothetical protein CTAYLR_007768 [Chrysophaeum taylorii]